MNDDWLPVNRRVKAKMPEPIPSQLKIDGIVTVSDGLSFDDFTIDFQEVRDRYKFQGTISPLNPDAESFMISVTRKDWEEKDRQIRSYESLAKHNKTMFEAGNKAYLELSGQLDNEKTYHGMLRNDHDDLLMKYDELKEKYETLQKKTQIRISSKRTEVKDSPIKAGLKRIWKWFKERASKSSVIENEPFRP